VKDLGRVRRKPLILGPDPSPSAQDDKARSYQNFFNGYEPASGKSSRRRKPAVNVEILPVLSKPRSDNGLSKFICDRKGRLLGIHILGHGAAELMHEAQLAKSLGLPFSRIASVIHAYPSYSDAVRQPAKRCYVDNLQNNFFLKLLRRIAPKKGQ